MIFEFGQLRLDTDAVELRGPSGVVPLEPKCFALLKFLIEERARAAKLGSAISRRDCHCLPELADPWMAMRVGLLCIITLADEAASASFGGRSVFTQKPISSGV